MSSSQVAMWTSGGAFTGHSVLNLPSANSTCVSINEFSSRSHYNGSSGRFERVFGNCFRDQITGQVHVCDSNCSQKVLSDKCQRICTLSGLVFSHIPQESSKNKKKRDDSILLEEDALYKRRVSQRHPTDEMVIE
mmetsp:Transcript_5580/g.9649  ORF Transcript_5580/g.9649 Transcript_5580/m.9649 type:complete len:135 (+) Transcript_5580:55-459(+)